MERPSRGTERVFPLSLAAATLVPLAALVLASPSTSATEIEPTQPTTIVVGPAPGASPMAGIDGQRRGRAHHPLPDHPTVLWRHAARTPIDPTSVCVDGLGAILVPSANVPELIELGK